LGTTHRLRNIRQGFFILDAVLALALLGVFMTLMAVGLSMHRRAETRLADTRAACNAAETALADLQQGKPVLTNATGNRVQVEPVTGSTAVPDFTWVRVTAVVDGRSVSLTGLAKSTALKGG
jgi:type II secretory pathway pseudopilin PulG